MTHRRPTNNPTSPRKNRRDDLHLHLVSSHDGRPHTITGSTSTSDHPSRDRVLRHIQNLQVLALTKPRMAKAILVMTERLANETLRKASGVLVAIGALL